MWSICKKEVRQFFSSLTGYIAIILFLLINGVFLFLLTDSSILETGYATLDRFFELAPWVLMFLVPSVAMRSFSDEFRSGTFEVLSTSPVTTYDILLGKYLSVVTVIVIALLPTLLYVFTIHSLSTSGDIDTGGIAGSYIGLFLLAATFASISLFCSSFTNNAVVAFLVSAFACLLLYFGFNALSRIPTFQGLVDYYIEMLGIDFHYRSISRGVVDTRDIIYFFSIIAIALFATARNISRKTMLRLRLGIIAVAGVVILLNWIGGLWHSRIDLTNDKRYTLTQPVRNLLTKMNETVTFDIVLKGEYPSGFRNLANTASDLLEEFRDIAGPKIQFKMVAPDEQIDGTSSTYGDTLSSMGFFPINLTSQLKESQQQQFVYPAAVVHYKDTIAGALLYQGKTPIINYQELTAAEALLEFRFADIISRLTRKEKPLVAYSTGHGEPMDISVYDMVENVLKQDYNLVTFNLAMQPSVPAEIKTLLLVKPKQPFTDFDKLKLDQFIMNGGKLLIFLDRLNAEMDSLQIKNEVIAYDRNLELNDLLFRYGARVNPDLVMDLQCDYLPFDVNGNGQFDMLPWNYFPVMEGNPQHPVTKNLGFVAGRFVNSIDTIEAEGITKTILLSSSANSKTISTPALISGRENVNAPEDEKFRKQHIPTAVLLEGKFSSLFSNRLSGSMRDSLAAANQTFLPRNTKANKIIIASDGDIVLNSVVKGNQPLQMGMNPYTYGSPREFPFANKEFLTNCLEYLTEENGLTEAKRKEYIIRLLDPKKLESEKTYWQVLNIGMPVALIILFAFVFQFLRKRKYSR